MAFNVSDPTQFGSMGKTLDEEFKQGSTTPSDNVPWTGAGDDPNRVLPGDTTRDLPSNQQYGDKDRDPLNPGSEGPGKPPL
jgi:hypothetical protein